jgi:hypothetical protein
MEAVGKKSRYPGQSSSLRGSPSGSTMASRSVAHALGVPCRHSCRHRRAQLAYSTSVKFTSICVATSTALPFNRVGS